MPKIVDHRARRAEIADAILEIIAEVGVSAITLRDVAQRCGWSTGVIHHYVGGREEMLVLAFRRASWLSGERVDGILSQSRTTTFEQLESILKSTLPLDAQSLALCRIYLFFYAEVAADQMLGRDMDRYIKSWSATIEVGVRAVMLERGLSMRHSREIANYLVALTDGFAAHAILGSVLEVDGHLTTSPPVHAWIEGALLLGQSITEDN